MLMMLGPTNQHASADSPSKTTEKGGIDSQDSLEQHVQQLSFRNA